MRRRFTSRSRRSKRRPYKKRFLRRRARRCKVVNRAHIFSRYANVLSGMVYASSTCEYDATNLILKGPSGVGATTLEYNAALSFRFFDLKNESEFTTLFDRFMLTGVRVQFQLITNPDSQTALHQSTGNQTANFYPKVWYTIDRDDNAPITRSQIQEYPGAKCRVLRPNAIVKAYIPYPRVRGMTTSSSAGAPSAQNGGIVSRPSYIDVAYDSTDHYGLKFAVDFLGIVATTAELYWVKLDVKYYFKCKDVR